VTEASCTGNGVTPILARQVRYLAGVACRAPSLHNTQPWHFSVGGDAIELRADASHRLNVDPDGREMLISCGAALTEIQPGPALRRLTAIVAAAGRRQDRDPRSRAETSRWSHGVTSPARDGVPAHAFPAEPAHTPVRLPQRDFDLGRGLGLSPAGGPPPPVTAALFTPGDSEQDWLQAGQALHRLLLGAATEWVFARLNTQPLEDPLTRTLIKEGLELSGAPQMLLALGISRTAHATARRPAADLIGP